MDEIKKNRNKKLNSLEKLGFSGYPIKSKRTHSCSEALKNFDSLSEKEIVLSGRITSMRQHGGLVFLHIKDTTGSIQALLRKDGVGKKSYIFFLDHFDMGDFIEIKGFLLLTKRGEKTLDIADYNMGAKSLRPLPEKWHGLKDVQERYRKRYLDLIFNSEVKNNFETRSKIIREIRIFLEKKGFMEVQTPVLQPLYGGAKAKPFKTRLNALDMPLYLRISPELYLKRLLVGGFEKVYEIGRCFRNEGMDRTHNPEFTMLEFYQAYADYKDLMKMTEEMFETILKKIFKSLKIEKDGKVIDFTPPWERIEFSDLLKRDTDIDLEEINEEALRKKAEKMGIFTKGDKMEIADEIYKKFCRPKIWNPLFVIHHPKGFFPLAKCLDEKKTANFQLVAGDFELINAFSELNDPIEQKKRFKEQEKNFKKGSEEALRLDEDYIESLEYGMPPAAGFGMGLDRLSALLTNSHSLREIIFFPTMRPKK